MATKPGFLRFVTAAFNARPFGMIVAPNWIGVATATLLGFFEPGFWAIGAGLELGYLVWLANSERFQRTVTAATLAAPSDAPAAEDWTARTGRALLQLGDGDRRRYQALAERCRSIIDLQVKNSAAGDIGLEGQHESLARLAWMYLRLLVGRDTIQKVQNDQRSGPDLSASLAALDTRLSAPDLSEELRRSLEGQAEILRQRVTHRAEATRQLTFIDSELARIEQQVELIREQAALSTDPAMLSQRIDEIAATLGGTSQWIRDQQHIFGAMEDLLTEPPPPSFSRRKERA
jgi:hypothetical protein